MPKELVISAAAHETRVALLEDGQLCEIYIEREKEFALVGSIYKGRVTRVLPGMQSAFVEIGLDSDAFLYVGDFLENLEDYDHVVNAVEGKVEKMEQQGGVVFAPPVPGEAAAPDVAAQSAHGDVEASHEGNHEAGPESHGASREPETHAPAEQPPAVARPSAPPSRPFVRQDRRPGAGQAPGYGNDRPDQRSDQRIDQHAGQQGGYRSGQGQPQGPRDSQGRDRGGRQRGGRFRRGRGNDRRPGRDLPPSKYAAPRAFTPSIPYEPPAEEPAADYTPVILPGESLAKYKDRAPSASGAAAGQRTKPEGAGVAPALPPSLYAEPARGSSAPASLPSKSSEAELTGSAQDTSAEPEALLNTEQPVELESEAGLTEPDTRLHETQQTLAHETLPETLEIAHPHAVAHETHEAHESPSGIADLSDDEATTLAEQLAEARQEEASADAEQARLAEPDESEEDEGSEQIGDEHGASQPFSEHASEQEDEHEAVGSESSETDSVETDVVETGSVEIDAVEINATETDEEDDAAEASPEGEHEPELSDAASSDTVAAGESAGTESDLENRGNVAPTAPQQRPLSARVSDPQRARFQRPMRRGNRPRGNRNVRHQDHRQQQPRRPQLISEMLKAGQEIIVQIAKEPLGKKGARITSHVALPGRFLVYMPTVNHIGVSRRIGSAEERARLRRIVTESKGTFPGGFIVRTAAEGAPEDEIRSDVEFLGRTWDKIRAQAEPRKSPALLHRDLNLVERILRDYVSNDYTAIWIDNEEEFGKVVDFVSRFQPKLVSRVKLYTKTIAYFRGIRHSAGTRQSAAPQSLAQIRRLHRD